jgi:hypothetical protein
MRMDTRKVERDALKPEDFGAPYSFAGTTEF